MSKYSFLLILGTLFFLSCSEDDGDAKSSSSANREVASEGYTPPEPPESQDSESGEDPLSFDSWHLNNTGQKSFAREGGKIGEDVGLGLLHQEGVQGEGLKLAFSDNGLELAHPELWPNHLPGKSRNYSSSSSDQWHDKNPYPLGERSIHAHGTSVAGLAVASAQNGIGSKGLAPKAKFAGFLYVGVSNSYAKMLDQAHGDFDIFNYSYGRNSCRFSSVPSGYIDQLQFGVNELRDGLGAIYVKAAGNEFVGLRTECVEESEIDFYLGNAALEREHSSPFMIVVGANNARGRSSSYSTPGSALWISAPGGEFGELDPGLISTDLMGCQRGSSHSEEDINDFESGQNAENENCDYTSTMNGTSGAAPLVSAAAALVLEANPELTWREVKLILAQTARKIDPFIGTTRHPIYPNLDGHIYQRGWEKNAAGFHFHNWYGFGAVDVSAAVKKAREYSGSLPKLQQTLKGDGRWKYVSQPGQLGLAVPDADAAGVENDIYVEEDLSVEAVQVRVSVDHTFASDLGVELTSPSGTVSQLMTINSGIAEKKLDDVLLLSNAFLGESSQGTWTLKVIDGAEEDLGVFQNWKINIWGHTSDESSSGATGLLSLTKDSAGTNDAYRGIEVKLNQRELQKSTRGPALPLSAQQAPAKIQSKPSALKKILKTTGQVHYEWQTYGLEKPEKDSSESKFKFIDFSLNQKLEGRLEVYSHKNLYQLQQRSVDKNEVNWKRSFSLPKNQKYVGVAWLSSNLVTLVSRDPKGTAFFWDIHKDKPIAQKKIETKLLSRLTNAKVMRLESQARFLVWDDYFLHAWPLAEVEERETFKPVSFEGEKIQTVFKDSGEVYVWTAKSQKMNLWRVKGHEAVRLRTRERSSSELKHLPLSRGSFLVRDENNAVWLKVLKSDEELKEELPGFPRLSGSFHVHIEDHVEGEVLVLWAYESESELFHQFKFYLEGRNDEK